MQNKRYISKYISIIFRHSQLYIYNRLKKYGIGRGQQTLLLTLYENGAMTQEQLARHLKIDKANITRSIDKLEDEGYVIRQRCENDKRAYHILLTDKAYEVREEIIKTVTNWSDVLTKGMSEDEQVLTLRLLSKMLDNARNSDLCNYDDN